jgi:ganglioside GM2 activator
LVEKKIAGFYVKIPCIDGIGSCTYGDLCKNWPQICPKLQPYGIPCTCPLPANTYTVTGIEVDVTRKLPPGASGDIRITANIQSPTAGHIFCLEMEINLN